jgi:squalene-hopene/tetraprenyl-beta-curcumene cyclase
MLRTPPAEYQDPSTEDLTGRVMVGLRACGDPEHTLRPAAAFLRTQQWGSRWFGRWDVNYQAGTAYALAGLGAAGVAPDDPAVASAAAWLETRQNTDGGWGEGIETYRAPDAGPAPSRADLTGTVLLGLLGVGRTDSPAVQRGVEWLVRSSRPDGTWQGPTPLYIVSPPDEFYSNPVASLAAPIEALGAWLGARG